VDGGTLGVIGGGAVVAEEDDEGFLAEFQIVERGHELADEFVHVVDVVFVVVVGAGGGVGRGQDFAVDVRHGVVEEEGLGAIAVEEADNELVHEVGEVLVVFEWRGDAVEQVGFAAILGVPVSAAALEFEMLVEAELDGTERELAPLADHGGGVARGLEDFGDEGFVGGFHGAGSVLVGGAGTEAVAAGHDEGS
jgi:hypothetical protein